MSRRNGPREHLKISKSADQSSVNLLSSNGVSATAKPGSAMPLISNNNENLQGFYKEKLNSAHPASPSCGKETNFQKKEISGEDKIAIKQAHFAKNLTTALPLAQVEKTGSTYPTAEDTSCNLGRRNERPLWEPWLWIVEPQGKGHHGHALQYTFRQRCLWRRKSAE